MSKFTINQKNFTRFSKRLEKLFEEKTNGQKLGHLEAQEFMSQILGFKDLHEFKKLMQNQENNSISNNNVFDPFDPNINNVSYFNEPQIATMEEEHIVDPLESKALSLNINPYTKYTYLYDVWHKPSHGININKKDELTSFLNDIEKSATIWKDSGVYLGLILQAVEKDTIIDIGYPIGLVPHLDKEEDTHLTSNDIRTLIETYKQYLTQQIVEDFDNVHVEVKPFYAINGQQINYEVVENNCNKRIKIKP